MFELEQMLMQLKKMLDKEKGIRNKILLENAYNALKDYEKSLSKD